MRIFRRLIFPVGPAIMPYVSIVCLHLTCYDISCLERSLAKLVQNFWLPVAFVMTVHIVLSENFSFCFRVVISHPCSVLFLFKWGDTENHEHYSGIAHFLLDSHARSLHGCALCFRGYFLWRSGVRLTSTDWQLGGTVLLNFVHIPAPGQDIGKADDDQACVGTNENMMHRQVFYC